MGRERAARQGVRYTADESETAQPALTVREKEVLEWVVQGKRDSEIAKLMDANQRTTEKHVAKILEKFSVETRAGAVSAYYEIELRELRRQNDLLRGENARLKQQLTRIKRVIDSGD